MFIQCIALKYDKAGSFGLIPPRSEAFVFPLTVTFPAASSENKKNSVNFHCSLWRFNVADISQRLCWRGKHITLVCHDTQQTPTLIKPPVFLPYLSTDPSPAVFPWQLGDCLSSWLAAPQTATRDKLRWTHTLPPLLCLSEPGLLCAHSTFEAFILIVFCKSLKTWF